MNEIGHGDLYQPSEPAPSKKNPRTTLVLAVVAAVVVASFGLGFFASDQAWISFGTNDPVNEGLPNRLDYSTVDEVYDALKKDFDGPLDEAALLDGIKKGLAQASGDAYTVYFNPEETQQFYSELNGSFEGIGAELGTEGDLVIVVAPIAGFPAAEAGLRPQDAIIEIDGEDAIGISVEEAVTRIRGEAGTDVALLIARGTERLEFTITRETITIPSVTWEYQNNDTIGYLQVSRFAEDTNALARQAAQEFKDRGVAGVILDLRSNSGGFVDSAVDVASIWLDDQVVFEQKSGGESEGIITANRDPILNGMKTVVLINEGSASASEIVAGALKDNQVATIVGVTSFGKGSVQQLDELSDGSTLKVTVARWFTPDGVSIDEEGITPDVTVEFTEADFENETDPQLDEAIKVINSTP